MSSGLTTLLLIWAGIAILAIFLLNSGLCRPVSGEPVYETGGARAIPSWMKQAWPDVAIKFLRLGLAAGLSYLVYSETENLQRRLFLEPDTSVILAGSMEYAPAAAIILGFSAAILLTRILLCLVPVLETYSIIWPEARTAVKNMTGKERETQRAFLISEMWLKLNRRNLAALSFRNTLQVFIAGWIIGGGLYLGIMNQYLLAGPVHGFSLSSTFSPNPVSYPFDKVMEAGVEAVLVVKEAQQDKRIPKFLIPHFTVKLVGGESIDLFALRGQDGRKKETLSEILVWLKKSGAPVNIKPLSPEYAREFPEINQLFTPLIEASKTVPARIESPL